MRIYRGKHILIGSSNMEEEEKGITFIVPYKVRMVKGYCVIRGKGRSMPIPNEIILDLAKRLNDNK